MNTIEEDFSTQTVCKRMFNHPISELSGVKQFLILEYKNTGTIFNILIKIAVHRWRNFSLKVFFGSYIKIFNQNTIIKNFVEYVHFSSTPFSILMKMKSRKITS